MEILFENDICLTCKTNISHFILKCSHVFCGECLCEYLENITSSEIKCPFEGCEEYISDGIIRKCISNDQNDIYDKYCFPKDAIKCLIPECPYVSGFSINGFFNCPNCEQPNCVSCKKLHPQDQSCKLLHKQENYVFEASKILKEKSRQKLLDLSKSHNVCKNPQKATCPICYKFLLPREGIQTTLCNHTFCRNCLTQHINGAATYHYLLCPKCDKHLEYGECAELIGDEKLEILSLKAVQHRFFKCRTSECEYWWFVENFVGVSRCPKCNKTTCFSCEAIHEGSTCNSYRNSKEYKELQKEKKAYNSLLPIICYNCQFPIIKGGGCGALRCEKCNSRICRFYGKQLGHTGCQCRKSKPCHKGCIFGCIPDGNSNIDQALRDYFNEVNIS